MENRLKLIFLFPVAILVGMIIGAGIVSKKNIEEKIKWKEMSDKHLTLFLLMNQWVKVKQDGKMLSLYFEKNNYKKIAVYGMSYAGKTLLHELRGTEIEVAYGIDVNTDYNYTDITIFKPNDKLGDVDAIVITPIFFADEIKEMLSEKIKCPIISIEDILYEI